MAEIRLAVEADVDTLIVMGRAMHAESPRYRGRAFSDDKLRGLAARLIGMQPDQAALIVATEGGELVGMFVALAVQDWFGDDWHLSELAVYVKPEHRGGMAFFRLVRAAERWAAGRGLPELEVGVSTGVASDAAVCAYQRLGYTLLPNAILTKKIHVHRS